MPSTLENLVGDATGRAFRALAVVRGSKSVHPRGETFDATLKISGDFDEPAVPLLSEPGEHPALVRFSRALGTPAPLPDIFGVAIRVLNAHGVGHHQDFLMVTSIDQPVLHHVLVPARGFQSLSYSTLAPYRLGGELRLLGLVPPEAGPRGEGSTTEERLRSAAATGDLSFSFCVAGLEGRFDPIGELSIGRHIPGGLDDRPFNVWNTGGGLEPATVVNRVRLAAYKQAQRGWTDPDVGP